MAKFPSQNRIWYETPSIGTSATSVGKVSLPKDLSILNRRGYASTTRKGVPLVYRCKVDYYVQDTDGVGLSAAVGTDFASTLHMEGCQNNWVMRNAAVKFHAARNEMFKKAGVKRSDLGKYAHEIRYNYDNASQTWLAPKDALGNDFTGGTWDQSALAYGGDSDFQLAIVGNGDDEGADAFAGSLLSIGHSYLVSRANVEADTNSHLDEVANFSVLRDMLSRDDLSSETVEDNIIGFAKNVQDNPPYEVLDISDSGDVQHDITEPVNLGIAVATIGGGYGSAIIDVPFGLLSMTARNHDAAGTSVTTTGAVALQVLDIFEMQG